ncbi:MAG: amidohydrolase family protein [Gemmatimonadaceae bacterium]
MKQFLAGFATLLCAFSIEAQQPAGSIVLAPDAVFDGTNLASHRGWIVVVIGNSITYAGPESGTQIPAGTRRLSMPGMTLLPGLIDAHVHLFLHPYNETPWNQQVLEEPLSLRVARATVHARNTLLAGFTTVRDLGTEGAGYADAGLKQAINTGIIPGPRLLISSKAIVATGSYAPSRTAYAYDTPLGAEEADGPELVHAIRDQIGHGADWVKLYGDYRWGPNGEAMPTFSADEMKLAAATAHSSGRELAVHAATPEGMMRAIAAGAKTIEHGDAGTPEVFRAMAKAGVAYCPTLAATESVQSYRGWHKGTGPSPEAVNQKHRAFAAARAAHVIFCNGSDAGVFTHGDNALELELLTEYGMPLAEVLRTATSQTAKILGMDALIG